MKNKIILIGILLVVLSGCESDGFYEGEIISCDYCNDWGLGDDKINSKVCECYNQNNISYTIDFGCGEKWFQCKGLTFEDKKKMAMIDDSWYCICEETAILYKCEDIELIDSPCMHKARYYWEEINRTTEFIWSY